MAKNVGKIDRGIRILVGLAIFFAGVYFNSYWGLLGMVPIATGLVQWCPAYCPLGISTLKPPQN
ncbi:MAG: DUF2892 domain-containing protein [Oligoflexia bacterium]|nr:DUF2892 domain-containing protein [Oligoflexia bacterium]